MVLFHVMRFCHVYLKVCLYIHKLILLLKVWMVSMIQRNFDAVFQEPVVNEHQAIPCSNVYSITLTNSSQVKVNIIQF